MRSAYSVVLVACSIACGEAPSIASHRSVSTEGQQMQGQQMQGQQMQGQQLQGQQMQGVALGTAPAETPITHGLSGWFTTHGWATVTVQGGHLVATTRNGRTWSGADLVGSYAPAQQGNTSFWTQITSASQDSQSTDASTWIYGVDLIDSNGNHTPLCAPDASGTSAAIPIGALFDQSGNRVESSNSFTFACTFGVAAKCIRWGYRPWLGDGTTTEFTDLHVACTRMARADYCGNGKTWTKNGTIINIWDRAPAPGPFQDRGAPDPNFFFEAGWTKHGAVCLSKQRWLSIPPQVANDCPSQLIPPGAAVGAATVCDTADQAQLIDTTTQLFDDSKVNVSP